MGSRLDPLGVLAALGGAVSMAVGVVLTKRWGRPAPLLATTGWQLVAAGVLLVPVALVVEGPPPAGLTGPNLAGFAYLSLVGTALAYVLWFRGIHRLPVTAVTFLGLLAPVAAVTGPAAQRSRSTSPSGSQSTTPSRASSASQPAIGHQPHVERNSEALRTTSGTLSRRPTSSWCWWKPTAPPAQCRVAPAARSRIAKSVSSPP